MLQQTLCTPATLSVIHQQVLELNLQLLILEFGRILAQLSWTNSSTLLLILHMALIWTLDSMPEKKRKDVM